MIILTVQASSFKTVVHLNYLLRVMMHQNELSQAKVLDKLNTRRKLFQLFLFSFNTISYNTVYLRSYLLCCLQVDLNGEPKCTASMVIKAAFPQSHSEYISSKSAEMRLYLLLSSLFLVDLLDQLMVCSPDGPRIYAVSVYFL